MSNFYDGFSYPLPQSRTLIQDDSDYPSTSSLHSSSGSCGSILGHTHRGSQAHIGHNQSCEQDFYNSDAASPDGSGTSFTENSLSRLSSEFSLLHTKYTECQRDNASLLHKNSDLCSKIRDLQNELSFKEGEARATEKLYQQLLSRIDSLDRPKSATNVSNPILLLANQPDHFPLHAEDDFLDDELPSLLWTKQDFNNAKQNSRGILQAQASDDADAETLSYIVDELGTVASANVQKSMRDYQRTVWKTLRKHGYAAPSWKHTDKMGKEFYYRCMHKKFPQFHLCNNDWKAEAFAVHYYSQWSEHLKDDRDPQTKVKLEKKDATVNLKLEPAMLPAAEPGIKSSKRPSSLTAVTSDRIKKTKSLPSSESNIQGPQRTVHIARRVQVVNTNPLSALPAALPHPVVPSNEHDTLKENVTEPLQINELEDVIFGHGGHDVPQDTTDSDIILLDPIAAQPALCAVPSVGSVTPTRAPALPTPAPALLDSPRGGAPPAPRKTAVWTAMTPPGAMTPPLA
ncbi:uncharacterized protein F5147DRAFT_779733 [Suillus discolor]|uniref:Uncharacterized protein n=1 Tax=Suillus discolor TaxID=1912936 RepID=A0A9P7EUV8_9AGAM|nr:uncharacterized protein F5147DRAFT_779733 [Suillus discolor]KAG2092112.1 hypothetical protein F5147DRAFT_779733 [Suillus discolor]